MLVLRAIVRAWNRVTYRTGTRNLTPHYVRGMGILQNRRPDRIDLNRL